MRARRGETCRPIDAAGRSQMTGEASARRDGRQDVTPVTNPTMFDLIAGTARVGMNASSRVAGVLTSRSVSLARTVLPSGVVDGPLDAIERRAGRRQDEAREVEQQGLEDVTKAAETMLNRVVVGLVDMMDMEQLIDHVPINRVVARIDLPEVIEEIDLSGIVREGTKGLGGEALDNARVGLMALDQWGARVVDRVLRRKRPRDLAVAVPGQPSSGEIGSELAR